MGIELTEEDGEERGRGTVEASSAGELHHGGDAGAESPPRCTALVLWLGGPRVAEWVKIGPRPLRSPWALGHLLTLIFRFGCWMDLHLRTFRRAHHRHVLLCHACTNSTIAR
uniref:Uncharacterized protein n=1 Tax=Oryza glumipatula TaxID=40148 RepID=A0A0D9ZQE1_9ORYZ